MQEQAATHRLTSDGAPRRGGPRAVAARSGGGPAQGRRRDDRAANAELDAVGGVVLALARIWAPCVKPLKYLKIPKPNFFD